ncbi:MAG: hypothetical protein GY750_06290 [Lentisphaerae bacterium]|nr:hypothetical protein [Lentisphaerota bacterium]MCP4101017.1 hypothetical protein [Lentisphaerota bacterium]
MSWDGKAFARPLIMLDFKTPQEAIEKNAYEPDDDVAPLIKDNMTSEQLIGFLKSKGMIKEACDFMANCVNRRVGVWWAYSCIKAVNKEIEEEFKKNPLSFEEKQKKDAEKKIAEWSDTSELKAIEDEFMAKGDKIKKDIGSIAGPKITDPSNPMRSAQRLINEQTQNNSIDFSLNEIDSVVSKMDPKKVSEARNIMERAFARYETKHGINPLKAVEQEITKAVAPDPIPEDTSLRDKYYGIIKQRVEAVEQHINQEMGKHFPLKIPGLPKPPEKSKIDDALFAVKRWILTPTDENGLIAMNSHKPALQEPEGICALAAYWSCSNLTPGEKSQVVPPPGLYSNGIKTSVYMCAMKKGGSKTYDERYDEYFDIGIECVTGVRTWDKAWKKKSATTVIEDNPNNLESAYGFGREEPESE